MRWIGIVAGALLALGLLPGMARAAEIEGQHIVLPARERQVNVTYFLRAGRRPSPRSCCCMAPGDSTARLPTMTAIARSSPATAWMRIWSIITASTTSAAWPAARMFLDRFAAWARLVDDLAGDLLAAKQSNGKVGLIGFSNGGFWPLGCRRWTRASMPPSFITAPCPFPSWIA